MNVVTEDDFSFVIVKPEAFNRKDEVLDSLARRGYTLTTPLLRTGWRNLIPFIYNEFTREELSTYIKGYDLGGWSDEFFIIFVKHPRGDTIRRLLRDKGHHRSYQDRPEKTLRAEFGQKKDTNALHGTITFVYCGIHCPDAKLDRDALIHQLSLSRPLFTLKSD